jgi:hypothetical protein
VTANAEFDLATVEEKESASNDIGITLAKLEEMIELNKYGTPAEVALVSEE